MKPRTAQPFELIFVAWLVVTTAGLLDPCGVRAVDYRPSEPDFPYGPGYQSGVTHYLKDNNIFWNIVSDRWHPEKRDTEGDIVQLPDGSLLLAWSDFYTDGWYDGSPSRISERRSTDGGRTWSPIETLQEQIGSNVMSVSLLRTSSDTILLTFLCKNGPDGTTHYVRRSTDGGYTFGPLILANAGGSYRVANNDRFMEVRDPQGIYGDGGRITLSCRDYPGRKGVMIYSDDDGLTWQAGSNVPVRPDWGSQNFNEPGIVELDDGRFWMYGRTTMGFHAQAWSTDRGMSWSTPEPMDLLGPCSPQVGERIPNTPYTEAMGWTGDILFTFPNHDFTNYPREFSYTARNPLDAAISSDGAQTWSHVRTIEEDPQMQYGYTSMTFVEDAEVGMRVLLTTHSQPIPGYEHRPHDLKFMSIPLAWFYEDVADPQRGIDFADEIPPEFPGPPDVHDAYGLAVLASGPVAYWRLDGTGDWEPGTTPGTPHVGQVHLRLESGSAGYPAGQPGPRPSEFDGFEADNNAVELLNTGPYPHYPAEYGGCLVTNGTVDLSGTGDFSMELWFKHVGERIGSSSISEDFVTNADLGYNTDMYLFELDGSGSPDFAPTAFRYKTKFSGEDTDFRRDVPDNLDWDAWHYLVYTKEGSVGSIYLDAELVGTGRVNGDVTSTAEVLGFGQDRNFKGLLDEIALYNYGLSAAEVASHYQAGLEGHPIPGDANRDDMVNDADAAILAAHWQYYAPSLLRWEHGDFNGDGKVTDADAAILATHWQQGTEAARNVPEPTPVVLLAGALLSLLLRKLWGQVLFLVFWLAWPGFWLRGVVAERWASNCFSLR